MDPGFRTGLQYQSMECQIDGAKRVNTMQDRHGELPFDNVALIVVHSALLSRILHILLFRCLGF